MYKDKTNARHDAGSKDVNKGREREKQREGQITHGCPPNFSLGTGYSLLEE